MKKHKGFVIWEGSSMLDGKPVALIATRGSRTNTNRKTGAMIQTYILRSDIPPIEASKTGEDLSICGDCPHRKAHAGTCYVRVEQGPTIVWKAYQRGTYPRLSMQEVQEQLTGAKVRLGAYGDAVAVPFIVWKNALQDTSGVTGYTHQWRNSLAQDFRFYCMASCDSASETLEARSKGWRTFTVVPSLSLAPIDKGVKVGAFLCPASHEAGKKLTCAQCMACGGLSSQNKAHVFIPVHGVAFKQERFSKLQLLQIDRLTDRIDQAMESMRESA